MLRPKVRACVRWLAHTAELMAAPALADGDVFVYDASACPRFRTLDKRAFMQPERHTSTPLTVPGVGPAIKCYYAFENVQPGQPRLARRAWSLLGRHAPVVVVQYKLDDKPSPKRRRTAHPPQLSVLPRGN